MYQLHNYNKKKIEDKNPDKILQSKNYYKTIKTLKTQTNSNATDTNYTKKTICFYIII